MLILLFGEEGTNQDFRLMKSGRMRTAPFGAYCYSNALKVYLSRMDSIDVYMKKKQKRSEEAEKLREQVKVRFALLFHLFIGYKYYQNIFNMIINHLHYMK